MSPFRNLTLVIMLIAGLLVAVPLESAEPAAVAATSPSAELLAQIRQAITQAIPPIERGAKISAEQRQCFTCHNQGVPVFALAEVSKRGFEIDIDNFQNQLQHTHKHLQRGQTGYAAGRGQGGQVMTAGYALWTLDVADWPADETTSAVVHYLLNYQNDKDFWTSTSQTRPPTAGSSWTATYVALRALDYYGTAEQQAEIGQRKSTVARWAAATKPRETEDFVFRLRMLPYLADHAPEDENAAGDLSIATATKALIELQQESGGWGQLPGAEADAYATATVLSALIEVGEMTLADPVVVRGVEWLLKQQQSDGTWHVVTRAKPIQEYYESGFPYEKDQFISISASGWALLTLVQSLP